MRKQVRSLSQLPKRINKKIGKAMHEYSMLSHGDRVLIGVSGGVDSLSLLWLLAEWRKKAPIDYSLHCAFVDNGFWRQGSGGKDPSVAISEYLEEIGVDFVVIPAPYKGLTEVNCFVCAKDRRSLLFNLCRDMGVNKLALGHHMDDLVETMFLNMLYSGNISTMVPNQQLFKGKLHIIRPMAYLEKKDVRVVAHMAGVKPVKNLCPVEKDTRRETVRRILADIYDKEPDAKRSLFKSLGNIRTGYTL